jgi:hypothetical protein
MRAPGPYAAAFSIAALAGASATADEASEALKVRAAAEEFDAGRRAFLQKDYETAAVHFEAADRDAPSVEALRLAIRARKQGGFGARAATLAQLALRRHGSDQATAALARGVIAELGPRLFQVRVACDPACALVVDGKAVFDEASAQTTIYLEPGRHGVAATWTGARGRVAQLEAREGGETLLVFRAPERAEPAAGAGSSGERASDAGRGKASARDPGGLPPAVVYVGLGLTAVLAGITIWSGADTRANPGRDTVERECVDRGEACPAYQQGLSNQRRTNVLLGSTIGVGAITGLLALFADWGGAGAAVEPAGAAASGLRVTATGRF